MDLDALSPSQREALRQLQALTNGGEAEVAIAILESVDWDVQVSHSFYTLSLGLGTACLVSSQGHLLDLWQKSWVLMKCRIFPAAHTYDEWIASSQSMLNCDNDAHP
jgi:hypothetical protein